MIQSHDLFSANDLQKCGIQVAMQHAELKHDGWADQTHEALKQFLSWHKSPFLCETFRVYAETEHGIPQPPSSRAYGGVIQRAKREGLIKHVGFGSTKNPSAHGTPASLWLGV